MAVPAHVLAQGELQLVTVASNDPGVEPLSTPGDYRVRIEVPLLFPGGGDSWVMTVAQASFETPGAGLYQIATSVNQRTIAGTKPVATIALIPAPAASPSFTWVPVSTIPLWYQISSELITEIEVEIATVGGAKITGPGPSVVTLAFRRVGART